MSEPKRYYLYAGLECHAFAKAEAVLKFSEEDDGMWVKYEEYARLKAEVERLTAFTTRTIIPNEMLQAEVERLTEELNYRKTIAIRVGIEAAKEGKQS
jgi:uncharacterized small protein (DUF1192 family)